MAEIEPLLPEFQDGWKLPGLDFRLDPPRASARAFVSHAHSDHVARHQRVICSPPTADLLSARYRLSGTRLEPHGFFQPWEESGHRFELLPAGHILGSAMLHVTRLADGASLLYTGDFKLRPGLTAEAAAPRPAGLLMMETTFGLPGYHFPPEAETWESAREWVRTALRMGKTPVLAGYSLGKAQEILARMAGLPCPILVHPSIFALDDAFRRHCPVPLPPVQPLTSGADCRGHLVVAPPNTLRSPLLSALPDQTTMVFTGWGLDPAARFRYRVDHVVPVSDHADFPDLLRLVEMVRPRRVLTVHGYQEAFAATLRARGIEAWSARGVDQLEFPFFPDQ